MDIRIKARLKGYTQTRYTDRIDSLEHQVALLQEQLFLIQSNITLLQNETLKKTDEIILDPNKE